MNDMSLGCAAVLEGSTGGKDGYLLRAYLLLPPGLFFCFSGSLLQKIQIIFIGRNLYNVHSLF